MVGHETVRVDLHLVPIFESCQKVIVDLLCSVGFEQPIPVVTLPRDVKIGMVVNNHIPGMGRHED